MNENNDTFETTTAGSVLPTTPDKATYIARHLGAQHLPLTTIIPISVVYSIIFIVGVLGNVSTICVILKNKYMHTPTNVYLANLAISDLLTHLVAMPFELYWLWRQYPWVFGDAVCDAKMLTTETVTYSSILTILAFTVERYMAICRPLTVPRRLSKMARAGWALVAIWICSVLFSLPWLYYNKVNYLTNEYTNEEMPESAWCAVPWNENSKAPLYLMISSTFVAFVIPFTLVTVLYFRIGVAMKKSSALQRCAAHGTHHSGDAPATECETEVNYNKGRQAVVRMLVAVVLVFFICWTPFHAQRLMFVIVTLLGKWTNANGQAHHILFLASGVGYYLSSCVNPLLYSVMSKRFRRGFVDMFRRSNSQNLQIMAMAPLENNGNPFEGACGGLAISDGAAADACGNHQRNHRYQVARVGKKELARYELRMAPPRHVIPPQHKKDILKKAFHLFDGSNSKEKVELHGNRSWGSERSSFYKCTASAPPDIVAANGSSPRLVVRWKRPNEKTSNNEFSMDRSLVQLEYPLGNGSICCSETLFTKCSKRKKSLNGRRKRKTSPNFVENSDDNWSLDWKMKSEGDTPEPEPEKTWKSP